VVHPVVVTYRGRRVKLARGWIVGALTNLAVVSGCGGDPVSTPPSLFGATGQIQVEVTSLLPGNAMNGRLNEILIWASNGPWLLSERVIYKGNLGGETLRASHLNPGELAREYASFIQQLNETRGLRLLGGEVPQSLEPECGDSLSSTEVIFTIRDDARSEIAQWTRCAEGTLFSFEPGSAGPDAGASRVITAGQLARFFTMGESSVSSYIGTVPFAVLAQGTDSPAKEEVPTAFVSSDGQAPADFVMFWQAHEDVGAALPGVEWASELVLLIAVGLRPEAGIAVRTRRVLPLGQGYGTRIEVIERVPGDFCSPAAKSDYPFQLIVVPTEDLHLPIEFTQPFVERIPCGV